METILSGEEISREMNISRTADKAKQRTTVWLREAREKEDFQALGISLKRGLSLIPT